MASGASDHIWSLKETIVMALITPVQGSQVILLVLLLFVVFRLGVWQGRR